MAEAGQSAEEAMTIQVKAFVLSAAERGIMAPHVAQRVVGAWR